ncbi:MAG: hypothetical protein SGBAC_010573 [Bacillariaceae sp.]
MSPRDSLKSSNHCKRNSDMNSSRRGSNHSKTNSDMNNSRRGSNHSKKNSGDLSSSLRGSINKLWTNRRCQSEHLRRKNQYIDDSDNDSVISDCSFASDSQPPTQNKPSSHNTLPETLPRDTTMFSNDSLKLIYLSWDVIRNMTEGKQKLVEKLFELLSDEEVPISKWFVGEKKMAHQTSFVDMIDMLVSMLSPTDLDVVSEELVSLGKRHAKHNEELIQVFLPSFFQHLTDAFCVALKRCVHKYLFEVPHDGTNGRASLNRSSSTRSLFAENNDDMEGNNNKQTNSWKSVEHAWQDLFWYIRCQMEEGAMMEYQEHKRLMEQKYQEDSGKEYNVVLKSEEEEEDLPSSKVAKPRSWSSRCSRSRRTSMSTIGSGASSSYDDNASTSHNSGVDDLSSGRRSSRKPRRSIPERLRLLRLNRSPSGSKKKKHSQLQRRASMPSILS